MTEQIADAGTSQPSGGSQAAAPAAPAETLLGAQPAAQAAQPQATDGKEPAPAEAAKPEGEAAEGKGTDSQAKPPEGAPEKYEFKTVEGTNLSESVLGQFSEVAKELNLSQEAAQKMLDKVAPAIAQQQQTAIKALNDQWVSEVKADKEIGGEKLDANIALAVKARDAFGTPALRTLLNESRLGNHPEVLRFFVKVGKAISEDSFVPGGTRTPSGSKDAATVLYGKQS